MAPDRIAIIQALIAQKNLATYLEIGVFNGHVLFRIRCPFKVAVDPHFAFGPARRIGKALLNASNRRIHYFEKTSDEFFAEDASSLFEHRTIDVALVDGMHEDDVALRDVENTLRYLSPRGTIVMHDCNPASRAAAAPYAEWKAAPPSTAPWNGVVWKAILRLRSRPDLRVFVLDCDHGLGIVTRGEPEGRLKFTEDDLRSLTFDDFQKHREEWLNLKPPGYFFEYLRSR